MGYYVRSFNMACLDGSDLAVMTEYWNRIAAEGKGTFSCSGNEIAVRSVGSMRTAIVVTFVKSIPLKRAAFYSIDIENTSILGRYFKNCTLGMLISEFNDLQ